MRLIFFGIKNGWKINPPGGRKVCWRWGLLTIMLVLLCGVLGYSQAGSANQKEDTQKVDILYADSSNILQTGGVFVQKLTGDVQLRLDSVFFYCDSAIIEEDRKVWAYGNIIIQQTDTINVFADSLEYDVEKKEAVLMGDTVILVNGAQQLFTNGLNYDLENKVATYRTGATLYNQETQLSSKIGYYYVETKQAFFKDSVVVIDPQFNLRTDTLEFNTETRVVFFLDSTLIVSDTSRIYCEGGYYDTEAGLAEFTKNAQFRRGDQLGKANIIRFDQRDSSFTLIGNAFIEAPDQRAVADTITYLQNQDVFSLKGKARFNDGPRLVEADKVYYDAKKETYSTEGRSFISDPPQILQANRVDFSEAEGAGVAIGNVIWQDTSAELTIKCERVNYDQKKDFLKAMGGERGRPLLMTLVDGDTMFMSADTLLAVRADYLDEWYADTTVALADSLMLNDSLGLQDSLQALNRPEQKTAAPEHEEKIMEADSSTQALADTLMLSAGSLMQDSIGLDSIQQDSLKAEEPEVDTSRFLIAYHDVRIFKSNIQALADSLTFHSRDSIFTFFNNPVMWSDTTQMKSDTIRIQLRNKAIDRVFLVQKAIIINARDDGYFNQIKGKQITAFFEQDSIDRMLVEGNAESIYYGLDEDGAYVGVNKTACSEMLIYFKNNQADRIKFLVQPQGTADPMRAVDHSTLRLEGFRWLYEARPRSVDDLFVPKDNQTVINQ